MGDALAALSLGIALEQLANLEEQHDEDSLRELGIGSWQEPDGECAHRGNRHEEVLVEGIAVSNALSRLLQRVMSDEQIGNQVDKQQLPSRQRHVFLDNDGGNEQYRGDDYAHQLVAQTAVVVVMFMMMLVRAAFLVMMMVVMVCHTLLHLNCFYFLRAKVGQNFCN